MRDRQDPLKDVELDLKDVAKGPLRFKLTGVVHVINSLLSKIRYVRNHYQQLEYHLDDKHLHQIKVAEAKSVAAMNSIQYLITKQENATQVLLQLETYIRDVCNEDYKQVIDENMLRAAEGIKALVASREKLLLKFSPTEIDAIDLFSAESERYSISAASTTLNSPGGSGDNSPNSSARNSASITEIHGTFFLSQRTASVNAIKHVKSNSCCVIL